MMDEIGVVLYVMSQRRYFYSSKSRLIASKEGANSTDLNTLGFYI